MMRSLKRLGIILTVAVTLSVAGCARNVYQYNMEHAYVAPAAGLSAQETEQVIRVVTKKSLRMIIGVTRDKNPEQVVVYADNGEEGLMVYKLKKAEDGAWHIVHYGEGSLTAM
jgi:type IV pilus biogenesis protein CpaD/CtpE